MGRWWEVRRVDLDGCCRDGTRWGFRGVSLDSCRCDETRWDGVGLNRDAPWWAGYCDAGGAVSSCAPCVFLSIAAYFDPSLCCCLHNFADVGTFEELGTF